MVNSQHTFINIPTHLEQTAKEKLLGKDKHCHDAYL